MIRDSKNRRATPNQVAKTRIIEAVDSGYYWSEQYRALDEMVTDKERAAIDKAVEKQISRVVKLLGGYKNFHTF
jgi:hypothetical protein